MLSSNELVLPEITKKNCGLYCGGVSIWYLFGVRPNNHCYFDKWYEIECSNNIFVVVAKSFLRRLQLEVLNISTDSITFQVMSCVTYFNCKGKQSQFAVNLTRSRFAYTFMNSSLQSIVASLFWCWQVQTTLLLLDAQQSHQNPTHPKLGHNISSIHSSLWLWCMKIIV